MRGICYEARTRGREAVLRVDEMLIVGGAGRWHKQLLAVLAVLCERRCCAGCADAERAGEIETKVIKDSVNHRGALLLVVRWGGEEAGVRQGEATAAINRREGEETRRGEMATAESGAEARRLLMGAMEERGRWDRGAGKIREAGRTASEGRGAYVRNRA